MSTGETLRSWLRSEIMTILRRTAEPSPLVLWCDPNQVWRDLLKAAADGSTFELWADGEHELILRERLLKCAPGPRVIWLPIALDAITYLKVFELQAEFVWKEPLIRALTRFGVEIARDHEPELREMLRAYALEHIDQPRSAWRELTPRNAKSALVDDDQILAALARTGTSLADMLGEDRMRVFVRRVVEDFGLPSPVGLGDEDWRTAATARLLVTDAAVRMPMDPPRDGEKIIPPGPARDRALKLLNRWQKDIELMPAFEERSQRADASTSLAYWARNLERDVPPLASRAAEDALFEIEVHDLARLDEFKPLSERLERREAFFVAHARGFWGTYAERRVPWQSPLELARVGALILQQSEVERGWQTPGHAVAWFTTTGWQVDRQSERLFRDDLPLPGGLHGVRARLRRAYLRHLDRCNAAFSELLHHQGIEAVDLPYGGELLAKARPQKDPMAVLVLDACRYDLGAQIAEALDRGEPVRRTTLQPARAPLPSITPLGMPFALVPESGSVRVELVNTGGARWRVTVADSTHDLANAETRREWLRRQFKLKPGAITDVKTVLANDPPTPNAAGKLLFVFGDEIDAQGHEGELRFSGADDYVERYVRVIRRLRDAGYSTVVVVTDHGFVHWDPERDEVEAKPTGEVLWSTRRAIVGRGLEHRTAIAATVPGSDLECRVPRSVNAFKTYGGLGYFHGGATLQEWITPVVVCTWPRKAEKVAAVLTPIAEITSLAPRVEVRAGVTQTTMFEGDAKVTGRQVVVKVVEPSSGRRLFGSASVKIEPEGPPLTLVLERAKDETCPRGSRLEVQVRDADNDQLLDRCDVELKIDLEEWD